MHQDHPRALLGGMSAQAFMRKHWQRKPLFVQGAIEAEKAGRVIDRPALFDLAAQDDVESRLVVKGSPNQAAWQLIQGPISGRRRPSIKQAAWTLLVQGVDLHRDEAHALLRCFDFLPQARLDDVMVSYATDGGGVGPHLDAYDVFLVQLSGKRRWSIGPVEQPRWQRGQPLKLLRGFKPEQSFTLQAGDMLYLPPGYGHDGVAVGECLTASVGFRAPSARELMQVLMPRVLDALDEEEVQTAGQKVTVDPRYLDQPRQPSDDTARVPQALQAFARHALARALAEQPECIDMALGEWLSEPKAQVWFEPRAARPSKPVQVTLDRRTRMLHDEGCLYINGQAFHVGGRDAHVLRQLAHRRRMDLSQLNRLSRNARLTVEQWLKDGWLHMQTQGDASNTL
jgi:50S ribosomal protein L16 3-hydroxylase